MHYFAYGSNLHPLRLQKRVPTARLLGVTRLRAHVLRFHKQGQDGSAKCDAWRTGRADDWLPGAVFEFASAERRVLHEVEGLGRGYELAKDSVKLGARSVKVFYYVAEPSFVDATLRPFDWYCALVLAGARRHGFSLSHIEAIEDTESRPDPNSERAALHAQLITEIAGAT